MLLAVLLADAVIRLRNAGVGNPPLDARWLACHAFGLDSAALLSQSQRELNEAECAAFDALIARRLRHEPVARIIGNREFWGLAFGLNEATLEPRPDSETLIEAVLSVAKNIGKARILDLGTGTGCLLLALLHEMPNATGVGIDIAPRAIEQARQNAVALGLDRCATFRTSNWFEGIAAPPSFPPPRGEGLREGGVLQKPLSTRCGMTENTPTPYPRPPGAGEDSGKACPEKFDIIVSNPPYIRSCDIPGLMPDVRHYDPHAALDGGEDGLVPYRFLIPQLRNFLKPQGIAAFEVGYDQAQEVMNLFQEAGFTKITAYRDLGGNERCIIAHMS